MNHLTGGISQKQFLQNFPGQSGIFLHDFLWKAEHANCYMMAKLENNQWEGKMGL